MLRVLYFGTPQVAVPFLSWLTEKTSVVGVVCRPDEPAGRGHEVKAPPAKIFALEKKIPVFQPEGAWTEKAISEFKALDADIGIIVAYGRILPRTIFGAPKHGSVNIHFSLLPKYRGAAPMQWALINGETKTGVSAFWLEEGLDSGPIFHSDDVAIAPADNIKTLREKLITKGIDTLSRVIADTQAGRLTRANQTGEPTLAPQLKKQDGRISWEKPASGIVNLIRGVMEWPGASTTYTPDGDAKTLKIIRASSQPGGKGEPGIITGADAKGISVRASDGNVLLEEVQPEGKKPMLAWSFWQGARLKVGDRFGA